MFTKAAIRRPRPILLGVLFFLLIAGFVGGGVAGKLTDEGFQAANAPSTLAGERIAQATGLSPGAGIVLLIDPPGDAPPGVERIAAVERELAGISGIGSTASPASAPGGGLAAQDGRSALVVGTLRADADDDDVVESALERFGDLGDVAVGGPLIAQEQIGSQVGADLARAELLAAPLLIALCLLFFGVRGALLPLLVSATTVLGTFLAITGINAVYPMSVFALNLVMGLGLGLAIDYTLFVLSRFRDELDTGAEVPAAIATTMATAGRTVAFSAATVAAALITLTVFPQGFIKSMGLAGAVVATVAALAALIISPALLSVLGTRLARRARRDSSPAVGHGAWYRLSHSVLRRPGVFAVGTMLVMLALAAPALRANWTPVDGSVIPQSQSARTVADALSTDFAGADVTSVTIAIDAGGPEAAGDVAAYAERVNALPGVAAPGEPRQLAANVWQLDLPVAGAPEDDAAQRLVGAVRSLDSGIAVLVGGPAAEFVDQQQSLADAMPLALGLLLALTMLVLWLMTGSVILPLKAVLMNALTVGSALGVLTLIYQDGRLTGLLGYTSNGGIEPTDFVVSAVVVFALSTDYGVFLLGRIKELRDAGHTEREAVAVGVQRTGHVVTAAAILLAVAIGAFSTSSISFIQQIGVAVAVGVLVDAFVVRTFLVPALMGLLGRWNWWSPMPLRRLHDRIGFSESAGAAPSQGAESLTEGALRPRLQE